jgi:uncharacterized protein GlcG (DUF336 family)
MAAARFRDSRSDMPPLLEAHSVSSATARAAVAEACTAASSMGVSICVAVVDRAGHLVAYERMDHAPLLCGELAQDKAYTVASFGLPTHEWWDMVRDEPSLVHGIVKTSRLVVYGGGVPIRSGEELVGAVGVSGGSPDQDREMAEAAAKACVGLFTQS